jgi:hypothetical protein
MPLTKASFAVINVAGTITSTTVGNSSSIPSFTFDQNGVISAVSNNSVIFPSGSNTAPSITTTGDTNTGIFFPTADTIAFAEGGVESMRIDSNGNLGVGANTIGSGTRLLVKYVPTADFTPVFNSAYNHLVLQGNNSGYAGITIASPNAGAQTGGLAFADTGAGAQGLVAYDHTLDAMYFNTNNTERMRINNLGLLQFNSGFGSVATAYGCRAWVNFSGDTGTIRAGGNVSSVTKNATGDYTVNFTTAMPDANYSTVTSSDGNLGANQTISAGLYAGGAYTTSAVRILVFLSGTGGFDRNIVCVSVFR